MREIVIDTSATLAVITHEPDRDRLTPTEIYLNLSPEEVLREFREKWQIQS